MTSEYNRKLKPDQNNEATSSKSNNIGNVTDKAGCEQQNLKSVHSNNEPNTVSDRSNPSHSSSDTALANDILAAAFNAALTSDVSLDSVFPFPLATRYDHSKPRAVLSTGVHEVFEKDGTFATDDERMSKNLDVNITSEQESKPVEEQKTVSTGDATLQKEETIKSHSDYSSNSKVEPGKGDAVVVNSGSMTQTGEVDSVQVFSPFSPFGQEIQSITNAKSPAPYKAPPISKVRRITPIPVKKGSSEDDESFQSVVQNSPVITDTIQSPLGQIVNEKSTDDSNSSIVRRGISEDTNKLSSIPVPFTEFGSNTVKSGDSLSQKSVDTETFSQRSDNSSGTVSSGNTADSSTAHALKISQPALFSEDANVGFTGTSEYIAEHISDDSLLQCLGKPAHFTDTIGTVSNLTNILYALDDKSSHFKSREVQEGKADNEQPNSHHGEKDSTTDLIISDNEKLTAKDHKEENGSETLKEANTATKTFIDKVDSDMITVNLLQSCDSSDSGKKTDNQYIPQSVQSIENLERIHSGLFRVTTLSDSESSLTQSNSLSQIHVVSNKDVMSSNENNLEQQSVELHNVKAENHDSAPIRKQLKVRKEVIGEKCELVYSVNEADSVQDCDKPERENCPEASDKINVTEDSEEEPQKASSVQKEANLNNCNTQIESLTTLNISETSVDQVKHKQPPNDQNSTPPTNLVTGENMTNYPENRADSEKQDAHSTQRINEQSVSDHDSDKQEIKRKGKKTEKIESDISLKKSKKREKKQKDEGMVDSPDGSSQESQMGAKHYVQLKEKVCKIDVD